jgi:hypothetical protein
MLRTLTKLLHRSGAGKSIPAARRKVASARPQVECLGERVLPATGLTLSAANLYNPQQSNLLLASLGSRPALAYFGPNLTGKSVELTGLVNGSAFDIGTVRFTSMDAAGNFQGFFESHFAPCFCPFGHSMYSSYYETSLDLGPTTVAISGHVGSGLLTLGGGYTYGISFSGAGDGMVLEHHHYLLDHMGQPDDGTIEDENFMVAAHQTINFSGAMYQSGSTLTLNGTAAETNSAAWLMGDTHTAPGTPNHTITPAPAWLVQVLSQPLTAQVSNPIV